MDYTSKASLAKKGKKNYGQSSNAASHIDKNTKHWPWFFKTPIFAPSSVPNIDSSEPSNDLKVNFVYGQRISDTKCCIFPISDNEIVYFAGSVGVVMNIETREQRFFTKHVDDVISLAVSPDKTVAATGQYGKDPVIYVWNLKTLEIVSELQGIHSRGVTCLAFSKDGSKLSSLGLEEQPVACIWDLKTNKPLGSNKTSSSPTKAEMFSMHWVEDEVLFAGPKFVKFAKIQEGALKISTGVIGTQHSLANAVSSAYISSEKLSIVGDSNGCFFIFEGHQVKKVIADEKKASLFGLVFDEKNSAIVVGYKDGRVKILSPKTFKEVSSFDLIDIEKQQLQVSLLSKQIRSLTKLNNQVIIATGGDLVSYDLSNSKLSILMQHHKPLPNPDLFAELWGLDVHPSLPYLVTGADDGYVIVWDYNQKKLIQHCKLPGKVRSVSIQNKKNSNSENQFLIAAGLSEGTIYLLQFSNNEKGLPSLTKVADIIEEKIKEEISVVKFNCQGNMLAVARQDGVFHLYEIHDDPKKLFSLFSHLKGHSARITHVDWSLDDQYLQSCDGAYELLRWTTKQRELDDEGLKDVEWVNTSLIVGWPVQGIWDTKYNDGTDINSISVCSSKPLVAVGNDFSQVRLYRYPLPVKEAQHRNHLVHSSHVTKVAFSPDGTKLFSLGGMDLCLIQWDLI